MVYELRHQPFKGVYLLFELVGTTCVRLPLWTLLAIPPSLRPRKAWSIGRCVRIALFRHLIAVGARVGRLRKVPDHLALFTGPGIKAVWVEPAPELVLGAVKGWAEAAGVECIRLPGYWIDKPGSDVPIGQSPAAGEKVVYALHGGAYISLSANPTDVTANIAKGLVQHCSSVRRAFSIEYRLSRGAPYTPAHPFPTALVDAIAGYKYLVDVVGFAPEDIIVEGDSAGGNLALALTRFLIENQGLVDDGSPKIPAPPGHLILMSPWTDLGTAHLGPGSSQQRLWKTDYLGADPRLQLASADHYPVASFLGPHPVSFTESNIYVSSAGGEVEAEGAYKGWPRTFVAAGGAEQLLDSIRTLRDRMERGGLEGKVKYVEEEDAVHDWCCMEWHEPERTRTLQAIATWLENAA